MKPIAESFAIQSLPFEPRQQKSLLPPANLRQDIEPLICYRETSKLVSLDCESCKKIVCYCYDSSIPSIRLMSRESCAQTEDRRSVKEASSLDTSGTTALVKKFLTHEKKIGNIPEMTKIDAKHMKAIRKKRAASRVPRYYGRSLFLSFVFVLRSPGSQTRQRKAAIHKVTVTSKTTITRAHPDT